MRLIVCIAVCLGAAGLGSLLTTPALRPRYARSEQTPLDCAQLAIWACLDNLIHSNGDRGLVGLAEGRLDSSPGATFPAAVIAQCCVVRPLLSAKVTGPGLRRNCHVVVRHPGNIDRTLESSSGRRLVAVAILGMG